jgi:hypothetical protein
MRWPAWGNAGLLLLASWLALVTMSVVPRADAQAVAAIFPPWWSGERAFGAAVASGAAILRTGALPTILVLRPADAGDLAALREAGAWIVGNSWPLGGCLTGE